MSDNQRSKWGTWALVNAAVAAVMIYRIAAATEAPSQTLAILQYVLLAGSLFACVGSAIKYMSET